MVLNGALKDDRSIVDGVDDGFPVGEEEGVECRGFRSRSLCMGWCDVLGNAEKAGRDKVVVAKCIRAIRNFWSCGWEI